jgi:hypothetical protein
VAPGAPCLTDHPGSCGRLGCRSGEPLRRESVRKIALTTCDWRLAHERRLQMHLASPTSPAHVAVSSDIMKKSFSATCWARMSRLEKAEFRKRLNMPSRGAMCGKPVAPRSTFSPRNRHRKCHFGERGHDRDGHLVSRSRRDRERVPARRP